MAWTERLKKHDLKFSKSRKWKTEFAEWLEGTESLERAFWICGKPASGKSTIVSYTASTRETRDRLNRSGQDWKILTFFFDYVAGNQIANTPDGMLRSLIYQLLQQKEDIPPYLEQGIRDWCSGSWKGHDIVDFAYQVIHRTDGHFCLFIDGLDEHNGSRVELVQTLDVIRTRTAIKIVFASRDLTEIRSQLASRPSIQMQDHNEVSMQAYLTSQIATAEQYNIHIREVFTSEIQELLIRKAEGVILWFKLAADSVVQAISPENSSTRMRQLIEDLPPDLERAYQRILETMDPSAKLEAAIMLLGMQIVQELESEGPNLELFRQIHNSLLDLSQHRPHIRLMDSPLDIESRSRLVLRGLLEIFQEERFWDTPNDPIWNMFLFEEQPSRLGRQSFGMLHETLRTYLRQTDWIKRNLPDVLRNQDLKNIALSLLANTDEKLDASSALDDSVIQRCYGEVDYLLLYEATESVPFWQRVLSLLFLIPPTLRVLVHGSYVVTACRFISPNLISVLFSEDHAEYPRVMRIQFRVLRHFMHRFGRNPIWLETNELCVQGLSKMWKLAAKADQQGVDPDPIIRKASQSNFSILSCCFAAFDGNLYFRRVRTLEFSDFRELSNIFLAIDYGLPTILARRFREDTTLKSRYHNVIANFAAEVACNSRRRANNQPVLTTLYDLGITMSKLQIRRLLGLHQRSDLSKLAHGIDLLIPLLGPSPIDQLGRERGCDCSPVYHGNCVLFHWASLNWDRDWIPLSREIYSSLAHILKSVVTAGGCLNEDCYPGGTVLHAIFDNTQQELSKNDAFFLDQGRTLRAKFTALVEAGADPERMKEGGDALKCAKKLRSRIAMKRKLYKDLSDVMGEIVHALEIYKQTHEWPDSGWLR